MNLEQSLQHFGIKGKIIGTSEGPLITQFKFRPAPGTKIKKIQAILKDIARETGIPSLRLSSLCDTDCIGFEVPNAKFKTVSLDEITASDDFLQQTGALPLLLGVAIDGTPVFADLAKMPHLLVAGTTGSGKSVELNAFIISLIKRKKPSEVKFVLLDPKRIEFSAYKDQEYLYMPVITDNERAFEALQMLVAEMNRRYALFEQSHTKNIQGYNQKASSPQNTPMAHSVEYNQKAPLPKNTPTARSKGNFANETLLPYLVVIIDEFSDLVLSDKRISQQIQILAQKARAAGIHLIMATQHPSVDVVTGSIKANFPSRMAFKTASGTDSKTILDETGAENLIGRGDALYLAANGEITRIHGAFASDSQIDAVLAPYRGVIKYPASMVESENAGQSKNKEEPFFLLSWFSALWNYLGKRNQKKLVNFIVETLFGAKKR